MRRFAQFAHSAIDEFGNHRLTDDQVDEFTGKLHYVRQTDGAEALAAAVADAEQELGDDVRRLHYLSVPPRAAVAVIDMLRSAGLVRALAGDHGEAVRQRSRERDQAQRPRP